MNAMYGNRPSSSCNSSSSSHSSSNKNNKKNKKMWHPTRSQKR